MRAFRGGYVRRGPSKAIGLLQNQLMQTVNVLVQRMSGTAAGRYRGEAG